MDRLAALPEQERQELMQTLPGLRPPDNIISDFENPSNHTKIGFVVTVICLTISSVCVILRAVSRVFYKRIVRIEDGLGLIAFGGLCAVVWSNFRVASLNAFFVHQWDVTIAKFLDILFAEYILTMGYGICMMFGKPAILLEWKRIFVPPHVRNKFYWTCWIMIVVNLLFYGASIIAVQFYCTPHRKIWARWVPGKCGDRRSMDAPSTVFNVVIDLVILILPLSVIWKLQMNKHRKFGVSIIFSVGFLAVISATGRSYKAFTMDYLGDVLYDVASTNLWIIAESTCLIAVFCIPTIPKVFSDSACVSHRRTSEITTANFTVPSSQSRQSNSRHGAFWCQLEGPKVLSEDDRDVYGALAGDGTSQVQLANFEEGTRRSTSTGQDDIEAGRT